MERVEDPAQKEGKLQRADAKDVCFIVIVDGFGILDFGMYTLLVLFYTSMHVDRSILWFWNGISTKRFDMAFWV